MGLGACPNARPTEETLKHYYSSGVTELRTTGSDKTHEDVKGQWDLGCGTMGPSSQSTTGVNERVAKGTKQPR